MQKSTYLEEKMKYSNRLVYTPSDSCLLFLLECTMYDTEGFIGFCKLQTNQRFKLNQIQDFIVPFESVLCFEYLNLKTCLSRGNIKL